MDSESGLGDHRICFRLTVAQQISNYGLSQGCIGSINCKPASSVYPNPEKLKASARAVNTYRGAASSIQTTTSQLAVWPSSSRRYGGGGWWGRRVAKASLPSGLYADRVFLLGDRARAPKQAQFSPGGSLSQTLGAVV